MKILRAACLITALIPVSSFAETFGIHIATYHNRSGLENFNPGVYMVTDNQIVVGIYRNSLDRTTLYGGYVFNKGPFSLMVGGGTGYRYRITPMVVPSIHYRGVRLSFLPEVKKVNKSNAIHLSYEFNY